MLEFFTYHSIPFWNMTIANELVSGEAWCLAEPNGQVIAIYSMDGSTSVDLSRYDGFYTVQWFDPRNGGPLQFGSRMALQAAGSFQTLGEPPSESDQDWAILLTQCTDCDLSTGDTDESSSLVIGLTVAATLAFLLLLVVVWLVRKQQAFKHEKSQSSSNAHEATDTNSSSHRDAVASAVAHPNDEHLDPVAIQILPEAMATTTVTLPQYKDQTRRHLREARNRRR